MRNKILIFVYLFLSQCIYSQEYISKEDAISDLDYFFETAEQIHPDLYFNISEVEMNKLRTEFEASIVDNLSLNDFSKELRIIINKLQDGHTTSHFSNDLWKNYSTLKTNLPFNVSIEDSTITILKSNDERLYPGDIILSINSLSVKELLELSKYPNVDFTELQSTVLANYFSYFLYIEYEFQDALTIEVLRDGLSVTQTVELLQYSEESKPKYSFNRYSDSISILEINSFSGINKNEFTFFLDSIFKQITSENTKKLIIDLRNNGGGNSLYTKLLLPYLNINEYNIHKEYSIKTSKPTKQYIKEKYLKWYLYPLYPFAFFSKAGRILLFNKNGTSTEVMTTESLKPVPNPYKGALYVLSSNNTYSAAVDLIVALKTMNRCTLVGTPISQPIAGYIDKIPFQLPQSKLSVSVSFKKYIYNTKHNHSKNGFILPDFYIDSQDISNLSIDEILKTTSLYP